ncbi:MAG: sugar phosphate isomerase/epimerase [Bacteroidia bacterium]|nr:sugar phosphate isomerase/epimerase [Bacteroidia bacterium]
MSSKRNRRQFLQNAGLITAGSLILPTWACKNNSQDNGSTTISSTDTVMTKGSLEKFGIQLYTLRDIIYEDPKATLKEISDLGFHQIEGYEGDLGISWGMSNKDFRSYLDDLGLELVSSHCDILKDFEKKAGDAAEMGMKYLICASIGPQKSKDEWGKVTDRFNECGEICRKNGIRFAYHNHDYSFKAFSGMIPHDFIMQNTDPDLVDYEMDIYWVVTGGADPIDYMTRYPNRFKLVHVKDRMKDVATDVGEASCNLGTGIIDFPKILKTAKDSGTEYFIMEQERYDDTTPMGAAKAGAEYLRQFKFA